MTRIKKLRFYLIAILPMVFWGVAYVWVKVVYKYYGPITTTFIRLFLSGSILLIIALLFKNFNKIKKEDYKLFFLLTIVDPLGYFICESIGLTKVSALVGSVIISTIPVFAAISAYFLLKEKLTLINFAGAIISFIGIGIMILKDNMTFTASPLGLLLILGAVICAILYSILIKKLSDKYSALTIITIQNLFGALYFLPLFLFFEFNHFITVEPNFELISNILLLSVFASTLAFMVYITIIREIGIAKTNMFVNLIPVFTLIASYYILKEELILKNIIGMIIVISGLYLSQIQARKQT